MKKNWLLKLITALAVLFCCAPHINAQSVSLIQSNSQSIVPYNTIYCGDSTVGNYTNSYYRVFKISDYVTATSFNVDSVSFGIDHYYSYGGGSLIVKLYQLNGTTLSASNLTLLNTYTYNNNYYYYSVDTQVVTVPLATSVLGTATIVMEVQSTIGSYYNYGNSFRMGSNTSGQTKPSYMRSSSCSNTTDLTNIDSLGLNHNVDLVMNVYGRGSSNPPITPPGDFINPIDTVCDGYNTVSYSIPALAGTTYNWSYSGTGASLYQSFGTASIIFNQGTTSGVLSVTATNSSGTSQARSMNITVLPGVGSINLYQNGDQLVANIYTTGPVTYTWYRNDTLISGANAYTYTYTQGGNYYVSVSNGNCSSVSAITTILNQPDSFINPDTIVCKGSTGILYSVPPVNGAYYYYWVYTGNDVSINNGNYYSNSNTATLDFGPNATSGQLSVSTGYYYGSALARTINITVTPKPSPTLVKTGNVLSAGSFSTYQWYRNNVTIAGATNPTYTVTQLGDYYVKVSSNGGCQGNSDTINVDEILPPAPTGIGDVSIADQIKLYPNPAKDNLNIESPVSVNAVIYSIDGRKMLQADKVKTLNLKSLPNGVYFITLTDNKGNFLKREKVVKL